MRLRQFRLIAEWVTSVLTNKPSRESRQDIRAVPTYTIPEAAAALAINRWTLGSWYEGPDPLLKASGTYLDNGTIKLLSFRDLEEVYKVHLLRTVHGKSMQYLQQALVDLRKQTKSEHPLLTHVVRVLDHLALDKPATKTKPRQIIPLGAGKHRTLYIPEVAEAWGHRIVADEHGDGRLIFPWRDAKVDGVSRPVSISANVHSGELVVTGTRIPVRVLKGYQDAGKSIEQIAELYRLDVDTVRKALYHVEPDSKAS